MESSRYHDRLLSFAVSAMITASFLATAPAVTINAAAGPQPAALMNAMEGLRNSGWHGMTNMVMPAPVIAPRTSTPAPAADEAPALTDAQVKILAKLLVDYGHDTALGSNVTSALGITAPGATITVRQISTPFDGHLARAFHILSDGGFLVAAVSAGNARTYRANAKQELVAAVDTKTGQAPVVIPVADAQRELKAELAFWAATADQLGGGQVAASH
jgi:hypothetical protein